MSERNSEADEAGRSLPRHDLLSIPRLIAGDLADMHIYRWLEPMGILPGSAPPVQSDEKKTVFIWTGKERNEEGIDAPRIPLTFHMIRDENEGILLHLLKRNERINGFHSGPIQRDRFSSSLCAQFAACF